MEVYFEPNSPCTEDVRTQLTGIMHRSTFEHALCLCHIVVFEEDNETISKKFYLISQSGRILLNQKEVDDISEKFSKELGTEWTPIPKNFDEVENCKYYCPPRSRFCGTDIPNTVILLKVVKEKIKSDEIKKFALDLGSRLGTLAESWCEHSAAGFSWKDFCERRCLPIETYSNFESQRFREHLSIIGKQRMEEWERLEECEYTGQDPKDTQSLEVLQGEIVGKFTELFNWFKDSELSAYKKLSGIKNALKVIENSRKKTPKGKKGKEIRKTINYVADMITTPFSVLEEQSKGLDRDPEKEFLESIESLRKQGTLSQQEYQRLRDNFALDSFLLNSICVLGRCAEDVIIHTLRQFDELKSRRSLVYGCVFNKKPNSNTKKKKKKLKIRKGMKYCRICRLTFEKSLNASFK